MMAQKVVDAIKRFQTELTGHAPKVITDMWSDETLAVTLHEALSPAEVVMSQNADGAARVQEYHRRLFESSAIGPRKEINRITGVTIRESAVEVETMTGADVHAFTSAVMVQVFRLSSVISAETWKNST